MGSIVRYLLSKYIFSQAGSAFPWATLAVNLSGCFIIGLLIGWFARCENLSAEVRMFLTVGFCGGLQPFRHLPVNLCYCSRPGEWLNFSLYIRN